MRLVDNLDAKLSILAKGYFLCIRIGSIQENSVCAASTDLRYLIDDIYVTNYVIFIQTLGKLTLIYDDELIRVKQTHPFYPFKGKSGCSISGESVIFS